MKTTSWSATYVEIAQLIAEKLGVKVNFVEGEWDGLLAGLDDGRDDVMVNGVGITPEREERYNFSTPYAYNRTAVIVRGDYDEIQSMSHLAVKFEIYFSTDANFTGVEFFVMLLLLWTIELKDD